jgi:L-methionine (R)-S-oxide reductase
MHNLNDQIASLFTNEPDGETQLKKALELILTDFHSETGTIHLFDAEKQLLHLWAQVGLPPQILEVVKTIPAGKGIAGQTAAQNKPVTICNLQTDTSGVAKPGARQTGVGGALCVPIQKDGVIVGTLGIGTQRQHEYTLDETRRLQDAANAIASALTAFE